MSHHGNFRNLLHVNKLDAFREWVQTQGYVVHPTPNPEKNIYECLRIELYDPSGGHPHLVFYKRLNAHHISIPKDSTNLVREFIDSNLTDEQKAKRKKKNKERSRRRRKMFAQLASEPIKSMIKPTKEEIEDAIDICDAMDLPDGAYWALVHEMLELEYGDVFPLMEEYGMLASTDVVEKP